VVAPGRLDAEWDRHRPAVFGVAYRVLGTVPDAEDVVQDVWLRAAQTSLAEVRDLSENGGPGVGDATQASRESHRHIGS
jgi:hypothetical protein